MQDYDAYLFDWDGTLVKSNEMWMDLIRDQLEPLGIYMTDNELATKLLGRWWTGMQELGFSEEEIMRFDKELDEASKVSYPLINLYPYVIKVLEALKNHNKKIALVTASGREIVDIALTAHELIDLFDVTVMGDEVRAPKPDPHGIEIALRRLGVAKDRAIMIGDSPKDLMAANNAGIDSLLFFPPEHAVQHNHEELEACKPTYTIRSWQEMLDQVQ